MDIPATLGTSAADGVAKIIVRNTFIDAVEEDEHDGQPDRTLSDQTYLRSKRVLHLGEHRQNPSVRAFQERASVIAEQPPGDDFDEENDFEAASRMVALGLPADDEDDDEDDDSPLARTQSVAYPAYGSSSLPGMPPGMGHHGCGGQVPGLMPGGTGLPPWGFPPPYNMWDSYGMFPYMHTRAMQQADGQEESAPSDWQPSMVPPLGAGPPIGFQHAFHPETREMGVVSPDFRVFSKVGYEGRLSVVSEREVHTDGVQRYLVQFTAGELSRADGVGFVFSPRLPCAKNIQRIVSIFVNQRGRICMRVFADIVRASAYVKPLELGDWVEMAIDLEERVATFNIWPRAPNGWPMHSGRPTSTAVFPYGQRLGRLNQVPEQDPGQGGRRGKGAPQAVKLNVGHLACVVKNVGVTVTLAS